MISKNEQNTVYNFMFLSRYKAKKLKYILFIDTKRERLNTRNQKILLISQRFIVERVAPFCTTAVERIVEPQSESALASTYAQTLLVAFGNEPLKKMI